MIKWTIKNQKTVFESNIFKVRSLACLHPVKSIEHNFHILDMPDWINVVALTEDDKFIMVRQHRLGTDEFTLETPAGLIEKGERPKTAALRELMEETGYKPKNITLMKKLYTNPAIMNNYIYFYLATGCAKIEKQRLDLAEDIEVRLYNKPEIQAMLQNGKINHSIIITALCLYFMGTPIN
jgi:ADP-ribose pyrophosphatase